jgi:hypothetical protein
MAACALLSLAIASPARAAFMDNYEAGYTVGDTLNADNSLYKPSHPYVTIAKDENDPIDSSQVILMQSTNSNGGYSTTSGIISFKNASGPLSGTVKASVDILPASATDRQSGIVFWDSDASPLTDGYAAWVDFKDGGAVVAYKRGQTAVTLASSFDNSHWYRVSFTMYIDDANGANSTYDVMVSDLSNGGAVIKTLQGLTTPGKPTNVDGGEFDAIANTPSGTPAVLNVRYDNLSLTPVPEPASLGLLGLGAWGLVLRRRRRFDAGSAPRTN